VSKLDLFGHRMLKFGASYVSSRQHHHTPTY